MTDFETFWQSYPRRIGKGCARRAYEKARKLASHDDIMAGLRTFIQAEPWHGDMQFCRSEEHTSELQSLMRISYAVFCLNTKKRNHNITTKSHIRQRTLRHHSNSH